MMETLKTLQRFRHSAVVWSWAFNLLRVANVLVLLPLLSHFLSEPDMGFHFVIWNLFAFVPFLDVGFLPAISRSISYAMAGARELKTEGTAGCGTSQAGPNFTLLWELMFTTRKLYQMLAGGVFIVVGIWGSFIVSRRIHETSDPDWSWLAWGLTLFGAVFEMYSGWWNAYLRGLNEVLPAARIMSITFLLRLGIACGLLVAGAGLISIPIATVISSALQRQLSRRRAMRFLNRHKFPAPEKNRILDLLRTLWPNSWRVGAHCLSNFLVPFSSMLLCTEFMGLAASSKLGLTQTVIGVVHGMANVWVQVKWPFLGQCLLKGDTLSPRPILRSRIGLQMISFALMAAAAILLTPWMLNLIGTSKSVIPTGWFIGLAAVAFVEAHTSSWATFVSLGNRLPFLHVTVGTNVISVIVCWILLAQTSLGFGALVIGPLCVSVFLTSWRWPAEGARVLGTTWWRLMLGRPGKTS